jgi:hypothetical protein
MTSTLSSEARRAVCAVLGFPRKTGPDGLGISDGALVLWLVLVLTSKPKVTDAERANGGLYHGDPDARCHDELGRKMGPSRTGEKAERKTVGAADDELAETLKLISRKRVTNELGAENGPHTPYTRTRHPDKGRPIEVSAVVVDFIVAVIREPRVSANRKAQAVRLAAERGLKLVGENDAFEEALGMTWKSVKRFFEDMEDAGVAHVVHIPPEHGKRGRCVHELTLMTPNTPLPAAAAVSTAPDRELVQAPAPGMLAASPSIDSSSPGAACALGTTQSEKMPEALTFAGAPGGDWAALFRQERTELWQGVREQVEEAIRLVELGVRAGDTVSDRDKVEMFVRPILALQNDEKRSNPAALKAALKVALERADGPCLGGNGVNRFRKFVPVVFAAKLKHYGHDSARAQTNGAVARASSIEAREAAARELLSESYRLNKSGGTAVARELLSDILARAQSLAELFDGDAAACRDALRLAFKHGSTDFVGARPNPYAAVDYLPEFTPAPAASRATKATT